MFDPELLITDRLRKIDASGIRRVFDLAATLKNPINLSIGQPDFDVPEAVKSAAIKAIQDGFNAYTQTQGTASLRETIDAQMARDYPDTLAGKTANTLREDASTLVTSGVSGGLLLSLMACAQPGDEVILPDPYFVMYRHLITLAGATPVYVDTYPDFQMTAERVEPLISERTKMILFNSPSNPTGVIATQNHCKQMLALAAKHNILLVSDEIYDEFTYDLDGKSQKRCPSPASNVGDAMNLLILRGFSKTYGMPGWRLGYAVGPKAIIEQMTKLQQYSFVCAPSMVQVAGVQALQTDMSEQIANYQRKRNIVVQTLSPHFNLSKPGGAFYAFPQVPEHKQMTGTQFVEQAVRNNVLVIPGCVFSNRDTHFRISFACSDDKLKQGLDILVQLSGNA